MLRVLRGNLASRRRPILAPAIQALAITQLTTRSKPLGHTLP